MKITKQRLKEIIREELNEANRFPPDETGRAAHERAAAHRARERAADLSGPGLDALQSDEKFTGGTPKEQMIRRIKARELLAAMSREELKDFAMSLDADMVAELRHLLANPMYAPMEENITPGVQQLMKHHPHAAAKIKELAGNGYRASEIKRMLQLR